MLKKISIIVPFYNAEKFIEKAVNSIFAQNYSNTEIILVNDGSTDRSLDICKNLASNDQRVIIIDKQRNEGVDYARFYGLEKASGDYITFLDADDWLYPDAFNTWLTIMNATNVDIVYANNTRVFSERFNIRRFRILDFNITEKVISGETKDTLFISFFGVNIIPVGVWGNLFKKELFSPLPRKSGLKFGEDLAMSMQLYDRAKEIFITSKPVLYYRWGGTTGKFQPNFIENCKELFKLKMEFLESTGNLHYKIRRSTIVELVNCLATYVHDLALYFPKDKDSNIDILRKEMQDEVYKYFGELNNDKYFVRGNLNEACRRLDYEEAYEIAKRQISGPRARITHTIKKIFLFGLKYIKL